MIFNWFVRKKSRAIFTTCQYPLSVKFGLGIRDFRFSKFYIDDFRLRDFLFRIGDWGSSGQSKIPNPKLSNPKSTFQNPNSANPKSLIPNLNFSSRQNPYCFTSNAYPKFTSNATHQTTTY